MLKACELNLPYIGDKRVDMPVRFWDLSSVFLWYTKVISTFQFFLLSAFWLKLSSSSFLLLSGTVCAS